MTSGAEAARRPSQWAIWFFGALGGILWGFDTGVISGAILFIPDDVPLTSLQEGLVVSGLLVGAMLGAGVSGRLADTLGRRLLILAGGIVFVVGTLGTALGVTVAMLVGFRFVMGIGVGIVSVVVPMYLSELAPAHIRGRLTSLMQLLVTVGIFLAYVTAYAFAEARDWRWMIGLGVIPAVVLAIGIYTQPESPRWLVAHKADGGEADARRLLRRLRGTTEIADAELDEIKESVRVEREHTERVSIRSLFAPRLRRLMVIGLLLVFFQNFVGINTIIYYAPTLLTEVGFGATGAIGANVAIGAVNMLMTLPGMWLIDRAGRRPLLRWGALGMCVAMIVLAVTNLSGLEQGPLLLGLTLAGIVVYIASFSISWGPVQWVLLPELFPLRVRAGAVAFCVTFNWLFNMTVALLFPSLLEAFGAGWNFLFFAVTTALGYVYATRLLPETKGRTLEQIERDLADPAAARS
ncbi:major facilitator transporter [Pseudonocardia sp. EC080610-09]|uniref:sugar porter family MFS transporter n=1 Tax=unclassified Pseudonocardia TaxID=2619320 RepID=UPI0006CB4B3E|nr:MULTISPECIES: sugar porter family MFS transporter [unclassified Pseudonocardia]ALE73391.1 major facilitator transporter [Pseudonocardia sp. EC080625-04]ALL77095.1 major facilitator transporter [Pseudonocardia sp. EC080610-09]ALL80008.1 major facilitator transporter [Pseudonocardia sp. EC080619-01]